MSEGQYDDVKVGDIMSLDELAFRNKHIYNNTLIGRLTGVVDSDGSKEVEIVTSNVLTNIGQDGTPDEVSQGGGIGTRTHDDVMLSWGYSRKVTKIVEIPSDDWVVITLTVPAGLNHHAEKRYLESYNGILEIRIITDLVEADLPASEEIMRPFNQKLAAYDPSTLSVFNYRGIHTSNPIAAEKITEFTEMDKIHIHAQTGNARQASEESNSAVKGRYYTGPESGTKIWTVLVNNISNATVEFTYIYNWHEF